MVTNAKGLLEETSAYLPFGKERIGVRYSSFTESRKYIGEEFDAGTGLSYLNARYYDGGRGRFVSQDAVFLSLGSPTAEKLAGQSLISILSNPQSFNSYSYANNNPINRCDPSGLFNIKTGAVEKGDTLGAITSLLNKTYKTNYSVSTIASLNSIPNANKISIGQTIVPNRKVPDVSVSLSSLMKSNAATISSLPTPLQKPAFIGAVFPNFGPWDLKVNNPTYNSTTYKDGFVFNGKKIRNDAPGNIHYGYVGKAAGFTDNTLMGGATTAQVGWDLVHGQISTGDNSGDAAYIQQGINLYNNK